MRSPHRKHERSSFFKYMTAEVAALVLKNRTLRWSSPVLFNDPFDVPRELILDLDYQDILRASAKCFSRLIENPPDDTSKLTPRIRLIVETVKNGITPEEKRVILESLAEPESTQSGSGQAVEELRRMWRALIPDLRILCLTERPNHAAMWCHYAGNYSGAVLEFHCLDETDSALLTAEKVTYPTEKPAIYNAEGWAELLVLHPSAASEELLHIATYTKAQDWSYEDEWRIVSYKSPADSGDFSDYPFHPRELAAIYLGPLITDSNQNSLVSLMSAYPSAKVFKVSLGASREFAIHQVGGFVE